MPQNITDSSTFTTPVVAPIGGDLRNAASVLTGLQALANRTKFLYDALVLGATKLQTYADAAALRAVTSHASGDVTALAGGNNGKVFVYDAASTRLDDGVLSIKPTDVGGGAGRWLHPAVALLGASPSFTGTVGFADIACTGAITAQGNISTQADFFASGDMTCAVAYVTTLTCSGAATISGGLTVSGGSGLTVSGGAACSLSGTLAVTGAVTCSSSLQANGAFTANSTSSFSGLATFTTGIAFSGAGTIRHRVYTGPNADATIAIADGDVVFTQTLTAARTYTLSNTGASAGMRIRFANKHATYSIDLATPEQGVVVAIGGALTRRAAEFTFIGGQWEQTD